MAERKFLKGNILLLVCAFVCLVCYDIFGGLWLKGFTSFWFVAIGSLNLVFCVKNKIKLFPYVSLMFLGLAFGMLADILLGLWFVGGILAFALGHILYLTAFCTLKRPEWKDLFIILPISAVGIVFVAFSPFIHVEDPFMEKLLLGYAVIISCMLGKAISNFTGNKSPYRLLTLIGSIMFWLSDLVLAIDMFGTASRWTWVLCSYNYWPAQCIIAFSLFFYAKELMGQKN